MLLLHPKLQACCCARCILFGIVCCNAASDSRQGTDQLNVAQAGTYASRLLQYISSQQDQSVARHCLLNCKRVTCSRTYRSAKKHQQGSVGGAAGRCTPYTYTAGLGSPKSCTESLAHVTRQRASQSHMLTDNTNRSSPQAGACLQKARSCIAST